MPALKESCCEQDYIRFPLLPDENNVYYAPYKETNNPVRLITLHLVISRSLDTNTNTHIGWRARGKDMFCYTCILPKKEK